MSFHASQPKSMLQYNNTPLENRVEPFVENQNDGRWQKSNHHFIDTAPLRYVNGQNFCHSEMQHYQPKFGSSGSPHSSGASAVAKSSPKWTRKPDGRWEVDVRSEAGKQKPVAMKDITHPQKMDSDKTTESLVISTRFESKTINNYR